LGVTRNVDYSYVEETADLGLQYRPIPQQMQKDSFFGSEPRLLCKVNSVLKYILLCLTLLVSNSAACPKNTVGYTIHIQNGC